jgi:hypothetical protein
MTCSKCNGTGARQCSPDCPFTLKTGTGRGWHCDVDARLEQGCPRCDACDELIALEGKEPTT